MAAASDSYGSSDSYAAPEKLVILRAAPAPRPIKLIKTYPTAGDRYFIISSKPAYSSAPLAASLSASAYAAPALSSYGGASLSSSSYAAPALSSYGGASLSSSSYAAPALVQEAYEAPSYDSAGPALASGYESSAPQSSGYESSSYETSAPVIQLVAAHPAPSYDSGATIELSAGSSYESAPAYESSAPAYESSAPAYESSAQAYAAPTLIAVAAPSSYESAPSSDYKK